MAGLLDYPELLGLLPMPSWDEFPGKSRATFGLYPPIGKRRPPPSTFDAPQPPVDTLGLPSVMPGLPDPGRLTFMAPPASEPAPAAPPAPPPPASPADEQAAAREAREVAALRMRRAMRPEGGRKESDITREDVATQIAKGLPIVGSYVDEIKAGGKALLGTGVAGESFWDSYDATVAAERARQKEVEDKNPALSTLLQLGGGVGGTGAALKWAPRIANVVFGNVGSTLPARVRAGAISGGAGGFVQGFGAGEGPLDRLWSAGKGMPLSAGVGGVLPALGYGTGKGYQRITGDADATAARIDEGISSPYAGAVVGPLADIYVRPHFPYLR